MICLNKYMPEMMLTTTFCLLTFMVVLMLSYNETCSFMTTYKNLPYLLQNYKRHFLLLWYSIWDFQQQYPITFLMLVFICLSYISFSLCKSWKEEQLQKELRKEHFKETVLDYIINDLENTYFENINSKDIDIIYELLSTENIAQKFLNEAHLAREADKVTLWNDFFSTNASIQNLYKTIRERLGFNETI